ncbi:MAG: hypothetical protein JNK94_02440 [Hyphomonadaceae bacterium]|nr:hypothetical protein [Hyphomonadaceae bacterium]
MIGRLLLTLSVALGLAACASTPPAYAPAAGTNSAGFSEQQIEANRYFVTYRAPNGADAALVQDYALLRAADLTLLNGREWFWVDRRGFDSAPSGGGASIGFGVGGATFGRRSATGVGVGVNFPIGAPAPARARSATLEIRFGQGPKPDEANAYDARSLSTSLRARLPGR